MSNNANLNWSLVGPRGAVISGRSFTASDSAHLGGNPAFNLLAGDYTLYIDGYRETTGPYSFRLMDVGLATVVVPGTAVTGQLNPGNETDIYKFNATAADRFYFDI